MYRPTIEPMTTTRSVALLAAVVVGFTAAPLASAAAVGSLTGSHALHADHSGTASTNASVGTLLQATAAETKETVETGMFEAAYETADNESRAAIVGDRTTELESQLRSLEAERAELREQRAGLSRGAYRSRLARLTVEIASLERSIERTNTTVADGSIDESDLAELRENATRLRENASAEAGPDVAAVARGLSDSDGAPGVGAGPPDDRGPPADKGASSSDRTPGNGAGTPTEAATGEGTEPGSPHGDDVPGKSGDTGAGSENGESNGDGTANRATGDDGTGPGNAAPGSNGDDNGNVGSSGDGAGSQGSDSAGADTGSGNGHSAGNDDGGSTGPSSAGSGPQGGDRTAGSGGGTGGASGGTDTGRGSR